MSKTSAGLIRHCKDKLGTPYVYGAKGEILTQAILPPRPGEPRHIHIHLQSQGSQVHRPALHGLFRPHQLAHRAHPW